MLSIVHINPKVVLFQHLTILQEILYCKKLKCYEKTKACSLKKKMKQTLL